MGKIKRLDKKDIARFDFIPVSDSRLRLKEGFVSYNTSEGKKAYGKLKRVGDELYLKDIKSGKRNTKIDEENIARFDFVQASQNEIAHVTQPKKKKNIEKIKSDIKKLDSANNNGDDLFIAVFMILVVASGGLVMVQGIAWFIGLFL